MWTLIHLIEAYGTEFGDEEDLRGLTQVTPELLLTAKDWLKILYVRRLNHDRYRQVLKHLFPSLTQEIQNAIRIMFEAMVNEDEIDLDVKLKLEAEIADVLN